jgi:putative transposon-encoded protein
MAGNDLKLSNAKLILEEVPVKRLLIRKVSRNNKTSGKITVPEDLINKEVYIVIPK